MIYVWQVDITLRQMTPRVIGLNKKCKTGHYTLHICLHPPVCVMSQQVY